MILPKVFGVFLREKRFAMLFPKDITRQESKVTHQEYKKKEKMIMIFGILCLLSVLMSLKYYNFFAENVMNSHAKIVKKSYIKNIFL